MNATEKFEYNKMCAEFLKWEKDKSDFYCIPKHLQYCEYCEFGESSMTDVITSDCDKFLTDWNWIMTMIDKIETFGSSLIMGRNIFSKFHFNRNEVELYFSKNNQYLFALHYCLNLDSTYKHTMYKSHVLKGFDFKGLGMKAAVVDAIYEFLKWHNKQNSNANI